MIIQLNYSIPQGRTVKLKDKTYSLKSPLQVFRLDWQGAYAGIYMSAQVAGEKIDVIGPVPIDEEDVRFTENMLLSSIVARHSALAKAGKPSKAKEELEKVLSIN